MFLQCLPSETACRTRCKIERFRTARPEVEKPALLPAKPARPEVRNPQWDVKQEDCTTISNSYQEKLVADRIRLHALRAAAHRLLSFSGKLLRQFNGKAAP